MKICVFNSGRHNGNTSMAKEIVIEQLKNHSDVEIADFYFPKDLPHFCCGCFNCYLKGVEKCPHAQYTLPIMEAIREADGLIFTTPVYVMGESAQIKAMLDHLGHMYIIHRPMEEMFSKSAMIISTTAGAGTKHSMGCIERSLKYWGVRKIYKCGFNIYALGWNNMKPTKKERFASILTKNADLFYNSMKSENKKPSVFARMLFFIFSNAMKKYEEGNLDKEYWKNKGWLEGKKPW